MDNDTTLNQFEEIERKIERLVGICEALKRTNEDLANKNAKLEEELRVRTEAEKTYRNEKDLIRSKIDGLLTKLDSIIEV